MILRSIFIFMALFFAFATPAQAQNAEFTGTSQVVDYAGLLNGSLVKQLEKQARNLEYISKRQVVILTVNSLEGRTAEDYADWIANEWNMNAETQGAVLLLVSKAEKAAYIKTIGSMDALNKPGVKDGITAAISAALRKGSAQSAITTGAGKMISALSGTANPRMPQKKSEWIQVALLVFIIFARMRYYRRRSLGGMVLDGLLGGSRRRW